jgi:CelD/BcsL family acetyltransferase involved in cellulose biosynthesis
MRPVGFDVFDYHDPVFDFSCLKDVRETFWLALKDELNRRRKEFDYVSIPRIREQFAANSEDFKQTDKAPYMDLSRFASFEELVSALPKLWRRDIRHQQRRLSKLAPLELRVCGEEDVEYAVKQFLPAFLKAHRARWPEAYQPAALYERLIVDGLAEGTVHLSTLASGDIPFSWGLGFLHKNRFYYYKGAWDADMAKFSPKKVHVARLLDRLISEHVEVFDFLPGQEPYKFQWTQTSTELFRHRYRMPGLQAGARYWWQMNLRPRVSRAKRFFAGTPASGGQA